MNYKEHREHKELKDLKIQEKGGFQMKVFISFDMEGVGGIASWEEMEKEKRMVMQLATREINAVVRGIKASGKTIEQIWVADSHGEGENLLPEELEEGITLIKGFPRPFYMMEGIDSSFNLLFLIGYHSRAGAFQGVMDHTYSASSIYEIRLNHKPVSELDINAGLASHYGVPLALVSGDNALIKEVKADYPKVETVVTKSGITRFASINRHPKEIREELFSKAKRAVLEADSFSCPKWELPLKVEVDFLNTLNADVVSLLPEVERKDGRKISFVSPDFVELYKKLMVIIRLALSVRKR